MGPLRAGLGSHLKRVGQCNLFSYCGQHACPMSRMRHTFSFRPSFPWPLLHLEVTLRIFKRIGSGRPIWGRNSLLLGFA